MRLIAAVRASERGPALQMVKTALATILAWIVSDLIIQEGPPPVFAAIAAMLVVQPSLNQSLTKGVERSAGVIAGVLLATGLGMAFGIASWVVFVAISAALAMSWVLRLTMGSANQIAISALLVLTIGASTPGYALVRVIETCIGAAIGIIIHVALVPPVVIAPARAKLESLGEETARALERLAQSLVSRTTRPDRLQLIADARQLHPMRDEAVEACDEADESLDLNPRAVRYREDLAELRETLTIVTKIGTQVRGMTRAFIDHYDDEVRNEPVVAGIAEELDRAAHDTRRLLRLTIPAPANGHDDETAPALTAPLDISAPHEMRWVLIGSLMEDLRRIRHELGAQSHERRGSRAPGAEVASGQSSPEVT